MSHVCILCLSGSRLRPEPEGRVLGVNDLFYAYIYLMDGVPTRVMISAIPHVPSTHELPDVWGRDFNEMCELADQELTRLLGYEDRTIYWSKGKNSGLRVVGHFHGHMVPRAAGQPDSGKGFALLRDAHNRLVAERAQLTALLRGVMAVADNN